MTKTNDWPEGGELRTVIREAESQRRVWGMVVGLGHAIERRDRRTGGHLERIGRLEAKIVRQKEAARSLEEVRAFERETEDILSKALETIRSSSCADPVVGEMTHREVAAAALASLAQRKGPRPEHIEDAEVVDEGREYRIISVEQLRNSGAFGAIPRDSMTDDEPF